MDSFKPWYASKTIWASIISLVAVSASAFGVDIDAELQTAFVETVLQVVAVAGSVMAVVGRVGATSMIE